MHLWKMPGSVPLTVSILACIKHGSPLPPEFWRGTIFTANAHEVKARENAKVKKGKKATKKKVKKKVTKTKMTKKNKKLD